MNKITQKIDLDLKLKKLEDRVAKFKNESRKFNEDFKESLILYVKKHLIKVKLEDLHKYIKETDLDKITINMYQSDARIDVTLPHILESSVKQSVISKKCDCVVGFNDDYFHLFKDNSSTILFHKGITFGDTIDGREIVEFKQTKNLIEFLFTYKMVDNCYYKVLDTKQYRFVLDRKELLQFLNTNEEKFVIPAAPIPFPLM